MSLFRSVLSFVYYYVNNIKNNKNLKYGFILAPIGFNIDYQDSKNTYNLLRSKNTSEDEDDDEYEEEYEEDLISTEKDDNVDDLETEEETQDEDQDEDDWLNQRIKKKQQQEKIKVKTEDEIRAEIDYSNLKKPKDKPKADRLIKLYTESAEVETPEYDQAESNEYIKSSFDVKNDRSVFSGKLRITAILLGIIFSILFLVGNYLNTSNPLIPLMSTTSKPFVINILDKNNIKIFEMSTINSGKDSLKIPEILSGTLLALHSILDKKRDSFIEDEDDVLSEDIVDLFQEKQENKEQIEAKKHKKNLSIIDSNCRIYKNNIEFANYQCPFSYTSFLINNLLPDENQAGNDNFISKIINSSEMIKTQLLLGWLKSNVTPEDFYKLYFTYVYFGYNAIGIELATKKYFNKTTDKLSLAESIFLVMQAYKNNYNLYGTNINITYDEILEKLIHNGIIEMNEVPIIIKELNSIPEMQENNSFIFYLEDIFNAGYKKYTTSNIANVQTSFAISIQNSFIGLAKNEMLKLRIPNASGIILNKTNVVSGFTIGLKDFEDTKSFNNFIFYKNIPNTYVLNLLKPFLYLTLNKRGVQTPNLLLQKQYQNLIFSYNIYNTYIHDQNKVLPTIGNEEKQDSESMKKDLQKSFSTNENPSLSVLTQTNLDIAPEFFRKKFASQILYLEQVLFNKLTVDDYSQTLATFNLDLKVDSIDNIFSYKTKFNVLDLVKAYSVFSNNSNMYNTRYLININNEPIPYERKTLATFDASFMDILQGSFFNSITFKTSNVTLYYILDINSAILFSDKYTMIIWLGDIKDESLSKDNYTQSLYNIVTGMAAILQN